MVTKADIEAKINSKKVVGYSKSYCPFCKKALAVFKKMNLPAEDFEWIEIESDPEMDKIQDILKGITGARSVPRVFINGKCIGGGDETVQLHSSGQLQKMIG